MRSQRATFLAPNLDQFGAEWYVLSPAGKKVEGKATMASASTSLNNSRGY